MLSLNLTTAQGRHHYTQSTDGKWRSRLSQTWKSCHVTVAEPGLNWGLQTPVQCCASWCRIFHEQGTPRAAVPVGCREGTQKRGAARQEHSGNPPSAGERHCEDGTEARRVFAEILQAGGSSRGRWVLSYSPSKAPSQLKLHFPFFV